MSEHDNLQLTWGTFSAAAKGWGVLALVIIVLAIVFFGNIPAWH